MTTLIAIGVCADRLGHATHDDYRADERGAAYVEQTLTVTPSSAFFVDPNKPLYVDWGHGDRVIGEIRHLERQADNLWAIGEIDTERLTDDIAANLGAADLYWSTEAFDDPQLGAGRRQIAPPRPRHRTGSKHVAEGPTVQRPPRTRRPHRSTPPRPTARPGRRTPTPQRPPHHRGRPPPNRDLARSHPGPLPPRGTHRRLGRRTRPIPHLRLTDHPPSGES